MNNELKALIDLQEIDKVIDACTEELEEIPSAIEEKRALISSCKDVVEQAKKNLTELQLKKKEKEIEIGSQEEKVRKSEKDLNSVKANDAYKALLGEIESAKNIKSALEDEILNIMVDMDKANQDIKDSEVNAKASQQELEGEIRKMEEELGKAKASLEAEVKKREGFAAGISQSMITRYDYIRNKKKSTAIASIVKDTCTGCNTILTQSLINEVKKGKDLVMCETCARILYCPAPVA